jgi:hypothetical protein
MHIYFSVIPSAKKLIKVEKVAEFGGRWIRRFEIERIEIDNYRPDRWRGLESGQESDISFEKCQRGLPRAGERRKVRSKRLRSEFSKCSKFHVHWWLDCIVSVDG